MDETPEFTYEGLEMQNKPNHKLLRGRIIGGLLLAAPLVYHLATTKPEVPIQTQTTETVAVEAASTSTPQRVGAYAQLPYKVVVIDPGHVGEGQKTGASQPHGFFAALQNIGEQRGFFETLSGPHITEAQITYSVATELKKLIRKNSAHTKVYLTATPQDSTTLQAKTKAADRLLQTANPGESILISLHSNYGAGDSVLAMYNQSNYGQRTLGELASDIFNKGTLENTKKKNLEQIVHPILDSVSTNIGLRNLGIHNDREAAHVGELHLLKNVDRNHLATLIEIGSMNSPVGLDYISKNPDKVAEALYQGLAR